MVLFQHSYGIITFEGGFAMLRMLLTVGSCIIVAVVLMGTYAVAMSLEDWLRQTQQFGEPIDRVQLPETERNAEFFPVSTSRSLRVPAFIGARMPTILQQLGLPFGKIWSDCIAIHGVMIFGKDCNLPVLAGAQTGTVKYKQEGGNSFEPAAMCLIAATGLVVAGVDVM